MLAVLHVLSWLNTQVLRAGRAIGWIALALMVGVILLQVVCRYAFNSALNWPDEAARFLMLWMTGLVAPSAYRWGGFVAITMVPRSLPAPGRADPVAGDPRALARGARHLCPARL